jgi:hypothetical protein
MARQILVVKLSNNKFRKNNFSGSGVLQRTYTDGQSNFYGCSIGTQARLKVRIIYKQYQLFELPQDDKERKEGRIN